jgi:hypothetical protein
MSTLEAVAVSLMSSVIVCLMTGLIGIERNWPDYVHVDYGLPVPWRIHVKSTFAGPKDEIRYNLLGLLSDLAFWVLVVGSVTMSLYLMSQSTPLSF